MCVSLRGHSTGLGVAGFAIRSRRDDGIDHGRCIVARSPKTMTKTRADPSARLKPPDSPAADAPRAKAQAVPLVACGMRAQRGPFTVVVNAAPVRRARRARRRGGPTGPAGGRGRGPRPDRSTSPGTSRDGPARGRSARCATVRSCRYCAIARSDTTGDPKRTSQIVFPRSFFLALPFWQKREAAAPWPRLQLSSARPGFPRYELRSRGSRPGLRWTYPIAKAHDCAPGRRRPRPSHHLEVTRSFSANVGCACASVQASRLGFPGDRLKLQWLISLNRRTRTTQSMVPACQTRYSGA